MRKRLSVSTHIAIGLAGTALSLFVTLGCLSASAASPPALYSPTPITTSELSGRTLRELTLMRNTIFARAGHTFRKKWLADYFASQPWYQPRKKDDDSQITALDRQNAKTIATYDSSLARAELLPRRDEVLARGKAGKSSPEDQIELHLLSQRLGEWIAPDAEVPVANRSPLEDPGVLDRLLTVHQLDNLSRRDLRVLRNTIYARHGRPFKSDLLQAYFDNMSWYHNDSAYNDRLLTDIDRRNIKIVRSVEDSLGGPLSDHDQKVEDGWIFEA